MIPTEDPYCFIEDQGDGWVIYHNTDGERWKLRGTCNQCGMCEVGTPTPERLVWRGKPGTPGACIDLTWGDRLDIPVRPEMRDDFSECSLYGEYLERGDKIIS